MQNNQTMNINQFSTLLKSEEKNETVAKLQQMVERVNAVELRSMHKRLRKTINRWGWC